MPGLVLSKCDIHAGQKISFVNETKWYKIQPTLKDWIQKIFRALPTNFVKCLNESWHKFCSFCMGKSEHNINPWLHFAHICMGKVRKMKTRVNIMLKNALFPTNHPNLENNYWNLSDSVPQFIKIFFSFTDPNCILPNFKVLNKMIQC